MVTTRFQSQPQAIASFDFVDIISGKAYEDFYAMSTLSGGATTDYRLYPNNSIYSTDVTITGGTSASTWTQVIDKDFSTEFTIPQTAEGLAVCSIGAVSYSETAGNQATTRVTIELYKNAEFIVSGSAAEFNRTSDSHVEKRYAIELTIPPTSFAIGDELILNVEGWAKKTGGTGTSSIAVGIDPKNRDDPDTLFAANTPTELILSVPFRPEI